MGVKGGQDNRVLGQRELSGGVAHEFKARMGYIQRFYLKHTKEQVLKNQEEHVLSEENSINHTTPDRRTQHGHGDSQ